MGDAFEFEESSFSRLIIGVVGTVRMRTNSGGQEVRSTLVDSGTA